jgi:hypothetical protein
MIGTDRDALLCDLAETYQIYDFGALPILTLAALSSGLRADSRIKMKMSGINYVSPIMLMAHICDNLTLLRYSMIAEKGDPVPPLFTDKLYGKEKDEGEYEAFNTAEEYEKAREEILRRAANV